MTRTVSLLFAFIGVALLCGIGASLSYRSLMMAFAFLAAFFIFMGFAFAYKARKRREREALEAEKRLKEER
jgi:Flp pilus assembly protein TadB